MDKRRTLVRHLRELERQREQVRVLDTALTALTPAERLVLEYTVLKPRTGAVETLCGLLEVERATVYRRRDSGLEKLAAVLGTG